MISRDSTYSCFQSLSQGPLYWFYPPSQFYLPTAQDKPQSLVPVYSICPFFLPSPNPLSVPTLSQLPPLQDPQPPLQHSEPSPGSKLASEKLTITSAKKNSQHNLASQFGSFFRSKHKSEVIICKILAALKITADSHVLKVIYWSLNEIFARMHRKYISLTLLKNLGDCQFYINNHPSLVKALVDDGSLSMENFCRFIRTAVSYYFRNLSILYVLTSKKLKSAARLAHLQRQRQMVETLLE